MIPPYTVADAMPMPFTLTENENARRDLNHIPKHSPAARNKTAPLFFYHVLGQSACFHHTSAEKPPQETPVWNRISNHSPPAATKWAATA